MLKLSIFNMAKFLTVVNGCAGAVNIIYADGRKENINKQDRLQQELEHKYEENRNYLRLTLDIPTPRDYLDIVYFSISDR